MNLNRCQNRIFNALMIESRKSPLASETSFVIFSPNFNQNFGQYHSWLEEIVVKISPPNPKGVHKF